MPQDIPVEASEVLAFTPPSLAAVMPDAPVFRLRAPTPRDKRYHIRLYRELGLQRHDDAAFRAEIMRGLEALWGEEKFAEHSPVLKAYWEAQDDFRLQLKDEPELKWSYDTDIEEAIKVLIEEVMRSWQPLGRMLADNAEFGEMVFPIIVSVIVKGWSNLDLRPAIERGYLTVDCTEALERRLSKLEESLGLTKGTAWVELASAATSRLVLEEGEEKNSVSPAPSETSQAPSTETNASGKDGKSPASPEISQTEVSPKTPASD